MEQNKQIIMGQKGNNRTKDVPIMVTLKYISNFQITLKMPLIVKLTFFSLGLKNVL